VLLEHTESVTKDNYYSLPAIYFLFCFMNFIMLSSSSTEQQATPAKTQQGSEVLQRPKESAALKD